MLSDDGQLSDGITEYLCGLVPVYERPIIAGVRFTLHGWQVEFLRYSTMWRLASIELGMKLYMWMASGTPEAFNYVGCEWVRYEAMWEADGSLSFFPSLFSRLYFTPFSLTLT